MDTLLIVAIGIPLLVLAFWLACIALLGALAGGWYSIAAAVIGYFAGGPAGMIAAVASVGLFYFFCVVYAHSR